MNREQGIMLMANALIHKYGDGAEEYASQQLWDCQHKADTVNAAHWRSMLDGLKKVRDLGQKIKK